MSPSLEDELRQQFDNAIRTLDLEVDEATAVVRVRRGVCTLRVGALAVKVFARSQSDYWQREARAYQALKVSDFAPPLVGTGDLWVATTWLDLVPPASQETIASTPMHHALGAALARLHTVNAGVLPRLPMRDRLDRWVRRPPEDLPPSLMRAIEKVIVPLVPLYRESHFVHGDWGDANVLVARDDPYRIMSVIDFETSHIGDPAEDFKWQLAQNGPPWSDFHAMATTYANAGGTLGSNASERLVLAAAEWSLDLLTWATDFGTSEFREGPLAALDAFVSRDWPALSY